jgi:predicted extracellular nuclease
LLLTAVCCASYFGTPAGKSATSDLFFSEYVEGSSNNKALEIYNGTGAPVDLAAGAYTVQLFSNGSTTAGTTLTLTGTLAAGDVYVIANASASATILAQADVTSGVTNYNGDDALTLRKGTTIIDVIGQVGFDPGTEWGTGLTSTADNTIRRKSSVCAGDTNATDAFDPAVQWDGFANDTFDGLGTHTAFCNNGGAPTVTINSPNVSEGNSGTTTLDFVVTLSADAPAGGVTFNIATADGTATLADNDYVANSVTGATIAAGARTYTFTVTINGDTVSEPNETFTVNVTNIVGASNTTAQGTGTIRNDDAASPTTTISQIQGSDLVSPAAGTDATVRGIVTLLRANDGGGGFFIQSTAADDDANDATSEGIFIFTNTTPTVAVGDAVTITGRVSERFQNTAITPASGGIIITSGGNALPAAVTLTPAILNPAGTRTQVERFEGMRLRADLLVSVTPSDTFGDFYTVIAGVARPLREPGIEISRPLPPGAPANVPRFDENPERIIVDSNGARVRPPAS